MLEIYLGYAVGLLNQNNEPGARYYIQQAFALIPPQKPPITFSKLLHQTANQISGYGNDKNFLAASLYLKALELADSTNYIELAKLLLDSALACCRYGKQADAEPPFNQVLRLIKEKKVGVNTTSSCGKTALHVAAYAGWPKKIYYLLKKLGADVNVTDTYSQSALHLAAINDHLEIVVSLAVTAGAKLELKSITGATALYYSVIRGHFRVAQTLLEAKADANAMTKHDGYTVLHVAACNGHQQIVRLLVQHGADINALTRYLKQTPLQLAAEKPHPETVRYLTAATNNAVSAKNFLVYRPVYFYMMWANQTVFSIVNVSYASPSNANLVGSSFSGWMPSQKLAPTLAPRQPSDELNQKQVSIKLNH